MSLGRKFATNPGSDIPDFSKTFQNLKNIKTLKSNLFTSPGTVQSIIHKLTKKGSLRRRSHRKRGPTTQSYRSSLPHQRSSRNLLHSLERANYYLHPQTGQRRKSPQELEIYLIIFTVRNLRTHYPLTYVQTI